MRALLAVAVLVVALELPELDAGTFTGQVLIQEQLRAQLPPHYHLGPYRGTGGVLRKELLTWWFMWMVRCPTPP